MSVCSVLFGSEADRLSAEPLGADLPFFRDLNLDQVIGGIAANKTEYDLRPFFHAPLHDVAAVTFRHEVFRDLEDARLLSDLSHFADSMRAVREQLGQLAKRHYEHQKESWFLDAVGLYGDAIKRLVHDLAASGIRSRGILAFKKYLEQYGASRHFTALADETKRLKAALAAIRCTVFIDGGHVEVRRYGGEANYSREVVETFERFQQGTVKEYAFAFSDAPEMNHIEAQILDGVAHLNRDTFSELASYRSGNKDFLDPTIAAFDREIQFYLGYLDYIAPLRHAGLQFCYPRVSTSRKEVYNSDGFDLALASKLASEHSRPVCNDFHLRDRERIIVVSGPNQGGKTTFARSFGQLHYLASLGCPVPGSRAQLYLPDRVLTHFEREERMTSLRGKLEDDVVRIHEILIAATPRSIIIINEIFASTALRDAVCLSKKVAAGLMDLGVLCVWVTFIDEVASLAEQTVSMVSTVAPDNPAQRTFKIMRRPADGLAYAMALAEKYGLTCEKILERVGP